MTLQRLSARAALPALLLGLACGAAPSPAPAPPPPTTATAMATLAPPPEPSPPHPSPDALFGALAHDMLEGLLAREPVQATILGDHRHDGQWPDVSPAGDAAERAFLVDLKARLATLPRQELSPQNRVDAHILEQQIEAALFSLEELRPRVTDPVSYAGLLGDGLDPLLTRDFAPLPERMRSLRARLSTLPAVVAVAKARLEAPARISTETAIDQVKGLVDLCEHGVAEAAAGAPEQRADLEAAGKAAAASLRELQAFLERDLLPRSTGSFRRGATRFARILRFSVGEEIDGDRLVADARAEMDRTLGQMVEVSRELWPSVVGGTAPPEPRTPQEQRALVRRVLSRLGDEATEPKTIVADATRLLGEATRFVQDHDLVRVPTEPCKVIEMPEYRRGVAIAYCDSSGPLEQKQETFYAISPAPRSWSPKRAASFYREYSRSMLADLTVHEAMPGHYLQAMHANAFHSDVRAVFQDGAFVEGWAVYAEWLMARYGFGGPRTRLQRMKMMLRLCANVILDHGVHAGAMEEKEALALMTQDAFQEDAEAVAKWRRARLSSGQLSTYFYGFRELLHLREAAERRPGFTERAFHDRLLGSGAPPIHEVRELLGG